MAELVREHADAAVLGLDGVVADPVAGAAEADARRSRVGTPPTTGPTPCAAAVGVRAVAPDGVGALGAATGLLAFAGVDRLEVVDVAVRLVEVAVTVEVVAIPDVERRRASRRCPRRSCRSAFIALYQASRLVGEEPADVAGADDAAAVVAAVGRLVERDLDPVADVAVDAVAARGLLQVPVRHRGVWRPCCRAGCLVVAPG